MKIIFIFFVFLNINIFSEENFNDLLMGSIVKSDMWEIDRIKKIEIFKGNVFFENKFYVFKSENAIYNHQTKKWDVFGDVYCKKKIDSIKYIELTCEKAIYDQYKQKAILSSNSSKKIEIKYFESYNSIYKAFSSKASLDIIKKETLFSGNFKIELSTITGFSNQAIYRENNNIFEMYQNPHIETFNDKYNLYIKGDKILVNIKEKSISIFSKVYGTIYKRKYGINSAKFNKKIW
ncbi:MAG: hypothetical protein N2Z20_02125 [Elusimicrobiales bacterium]|nr:hypothetical protein [Elusimicrobiales bacterium]